MVLEIPRCETLRIGRGIAAAERAEVGAAPSLDLSATHWDATFVETLSTGTVKTWTLHIGDSFADVARSHWAYVGLEALPHAGLTTGCLQQPLRYCPESLLTRAEMAVFLQRTLGLRLAE